jgi:hypothetical protein
LQLISLVGSNQHKNWQNRGNITNMMILMTVDETLTYLLSINKKYIIHFLIYMIFYVFFFMPSLEWIWASRSKHLFLYVANSFLSSVTRIVSLFEILSLMFLCCSIFSKSRLSDKSFDYLFAFSTESSFPVLFYCFSGLGVNFV